MKALGVTDEQFKEALEGVEASITASLTKGTNATLILVCGMQYTVYKTKIEP